MRDSVIADKSKHNNTIYSVMSFGQWKHVLAYLCEPFMSF